MTETRRATEFDLALGLRLRNARIARRITQKQLADLIGVKFQQVQKYEKGENRITAERLLEVSKILKQPIGYFLGEAERYTRSRGLFSAESLRLAAEFDKLPDEAIRKRMKALIQAITGAWESRSREQI